MTAGALRAPAVASRPPTPSGIAARRFHFCRRALCRGALLGAAGIGLSACGGGVPLFHSAHVIQPGNTRFGAGVSGNVALAKLPSSPDSRGVTADEGLQDLTVAPQVAPWVGARIGLAGDNEAGLSYSGRAIRIDGRHAFSLGGPALSVGLGASALVGTPTGPFRGSNGLYGGGLDVPVLLGFRSTSDLYAIWFGPRAGVDLISAVVGEVSVSSIGARHLYAGITAGFKAGFRHVHVAFELNGSYHRSDGFFDGRALGQNQFTLTPGGALLFSF